MTPKTLTAIPCGRNAAMVGTAETVWRAGSLRADKRTFVGVVAAVVVAVCGRGTAKVNTNSHTFSVANRIC